MELNVTEYIEKLSPAGVLVRLAVVEQVKPLNSRMRDMCGRCTDKTWRSVDKCLLPWLKVGDLLLEIERSQPIPDRDLQSR